MTERIDLNARDGHASVNGNGAALVNQWKGRASRSKTQHPSWHVCCGDARAVLRNLRDGQFGCVVTSPPYFWQRDYRVEGQMGLERSVSGYVNALADTMDEVYRVLDPNGVVFLNLGDTYYSGKGRPKGVDPKHSGRRLGVLRAVDASGLGMPQKTALGMPWRVALEMIARGWILRSPIIWRRENAIPEANVLDRPWRTYEFVFMFARSRHYHFSREALEAAGEEDVWTIASQGSCDRKHPAAFPTELVRRCIDLAHFRKGWVLDPFAGSGRGVVCGSAARRIVFVDGVNELPHERWALRSEGRSSLERRPARTSFCYPTLAPPANTDALCSSSRRSAAGR